MRAGLLAVTRNAFYALQSEDNQNWGRLTKICYFIHTKYSNYKTRNTCKIIELIIGQNKRRSQLDAYHAVLMLIFTKAKIVTIRFILISSVLR